MKATRPVMRYHGGKWRIAPWVISHFPPHRIYVEPFGGAASVLMRKGRTYAEVYNDLDGEVVNVFRTLRNPSDAERLAELLRLTPFARDEFEGAYDPDPNADQVERARLTIVKAFMGFGSAAIHDVFPRGMRTRASSWRPPTGFRSNSSRSGTTAAKDWSNYPAQLTAFCSRLAGVVIENRPALEVIAQHDHLDALFYVDPPYLGSLRNARRTNGKVYTHDMTDDDDHIALLEALCELEGAVVLSGYPCPLYDDLLQGWVSVSRETIADGSAARTEVLWLNPHVAQRCSQKVLAL